MTSRRYRTEPEVEVLVHEQRPERERPIGELVLVHGLEGSSEAGYARSLAQAALEAGYAVHRFNMRSCGGMEAFCGSRLYHSGQTSDLLVVLQRLRSEGRGPFYVTGFSLGGNVTLKLAGELGESARGWIQACAAVSTPIDLAACVRLLDKPGNRIYADRFLRRLKQRVRRKERLAPGSFDLEPLDRIRNIYEFDDTYTARAFGFGTADCYYATQSSLGFLAGIRVPCLLVQAQDDPLIPFEIYRDVAARNENLRVLAPEHGGHLGFLSRRKPRFWLDGVLLQWFQETRNKSQIR